MIRIGLAAGKIVGVEAMRSSDKRRLVMDGDPRDRVGLMRCHRGPIGKRQTFLKGIVESFQELSTRKAVRRVELWCCPGYSW